MDRPITFNGVIHDAYNYAMLHNGVPLVHEITAENGSTGALDSMTVEVVFDPPLIKPYRTVLARLDPGLPVRISPVPLEPSVSDWLGLTESVDCRLTVRASALDGTELGLMIRQIRLLPFDQWLGVQVMPELTCAFVTPNDPRLGPILARGSAFLQQWTGSPSCNDYQSGNRDVVKRQAAALYSALQEVGIAYMPPPASFGVGQRVRLPGDVLDQKLGTCLDFALLYVSLLEAIGLHALLILIEGHAFAGVWLEETSFPEPVQDDPAALRKRMAAGIEELIPVECTTVAAGQRQPFEEAVRLAMAAVPTADRPIWVIDVRRCRLSPVLPLPSRILENGVWRSEGYAADDPAALSGAPDAMAVRDPDAPASAAPLSKRQIWERNLLDLSLRNLLINFRVTRSTLQLLIDDPALLEDALADGEQFRILARPREWSAAPGTNRLYNLGELPAELSELLRGEFAAHRLRACPEEAETLAALKFLYRGARVSLEENGSNTLFLALGFLRWYETAQSERARFAPIVLVPVELTFKASAQEYALRIRDEETRVNITLLEMLRQDYGIRVEGLDPLPADESGTHLRQVFNIVRQAVIGRKNWDVEDTVCLGLFSFTQFVLWNDIHSRSDDLMRSEVVRSLVAGGLQWQPEIPEESVETLDLIQDPADMAVPISADASQMAAIRAAAAGQSFVLHGPPGTGKSQTITNLIADALYHGKSVLFVAEKMAALSVVQNRLTSIGLGPFSLELHSNKARKRDVLDRIDQALRFGRTKAPERHAETAARLLTARRSLAAVSAELHKVRDFGWSIYDLISRYEPLRGLKGRVSAPDDWLDRMSPKQLETWRDRLGSLLSAASACRAGIVDHPLNAFAVRDYQLDTREKTERSLIALRDSVSRERERIAAPAAIAGVTVNPDGERYDPDREQSAPDGELSLRQISVLAAIAAIGDQPVIPPAELAGQIGLAGRGEAVHSLLQRLRETQQRAVEMESFFLPEAAALDAACLLQEWRVAAQSWSLKRWLAHGRLMKQLRANAREPSRLTRESADGLLVLLAGYQADRLWLEERANDTQNPFGTLWRGRQSDAAYLFAVWQSAAALQEAAAAFGDVPATQAARAAKIAGAWTDASVRGLFGEFLAAHRERLRRADAVQADCQIRMPASDAANWRLTDLDRQIDIWLDALDELRNWSQFLRQSDLAVQEGLLPVVEAYGSGQLGAGELVPAFLCALYYGQIVRTIARVPELVRFSGDQYEENIRRLGELDDRFSELTVRELVARLSAGIPVSGLAGPVADSSEIAIVQRAIRSGGRMMSIRKLFASAPNLLRRICPCMLMSPISVAQYIDPAWPKFDLVIFDEASQLPTSEAVGAVARGEHAIVVGDPKQLPPTRFFTRNNPDPENDEIAGPDQEDLESLLDDCLALSMPSQYLRWHYRSRHESLIAYSNQRFYESRLQTFPSPDALRSAVRLVAVEGTYDRGATRQNIAEGRAVVDEIVRRLRDPLLRRQSIGVVTFSVQQQYLIEDLLAEAMRRDPRLEEIDRASAEPLFIKNLENVQGDERDVILFSIGYGPDKDGKVTLNFGPINREGGWRRLNVAITRARREMVVYAVLRPDQIDVSRMRSEGVAGLRGFLEFAASGKNRLPVSADEMRAPETSLEKEIAARLSERGYTVETAIGYSSYKLDLGIAHPDDAERFLLGIHGDGLSWYHAGNIRDRVLLHPSVLKGLGWHLKRIWTLDWLDDPQRELRRIEEAFQQAVEADKQQNLAAESAQLANNEPVQQFEPDPAPIPDGQADCLPYVVYRPERTFSGEAFYRPENRAAIRTMIAAILAAEAPISETLLQRRLFDSWGVERMTTRAETVFAAMIGGLQPRQTTGGEKIFYWSAEQDPETYRCCRVSTRAGERRSMDDICPQETAAAIAVVLQRQLSLSVNDLIRETARIFGFTRSGNLIQASVVAGLEEARRREWAEDDAERQKVRGGRLLY